MTSQGALKHISATPKDGQALLYGTTGTDLYKLYSNVSTTIATTAATALHPMGDPIRDKQALKVGIEATAANNYPFVFNMTVDNENRSSPTYTLTSYVTWVNNSNSTISWLNNSSNIVQWGTVGYNLYKTDAQQYGKYLGMTVTSSSPGYTINGFEYEHELRARF